jgi:hypothetical protein
MKKLLLLGTMLMSAVASVAMLCLPTRSYLRRS